MNALIFLAAAAGSPALEPVIVTATRTEVPAAEMLASVDIITGNNLQMRARRRPRRRAALRARASKSRDSAAPASRRRVFVRGTESNHVLVLMDGLRMNPGTIGTAAMQNVAPEFVERVEVVKGPRSTLYGSDAIGGVINIITRRGANQADSVQAGYGAYDTTHRQLLGRHRRRDARKPRSPPPGSTARASRRASATTRDRGYENTSFNALARTGVGPVDLSLSAWYASGTSEYSDFFVHARRPGLREHDARARRRISRRPRPGARASCRARDRRPRAEPVRGLPRHQAQHRRLAERLRRCRKRRHAHGGRPLAGRGSRRRVLRRALCGRHDDEPVLRPGPGAASARTACCSAPLTPTTRLSAATPRGTRSTAAPSARAALVTFVGGHGVSRAGRDGPVWLRRQPGPRAGGVAERSK